MKLTSTHWTIIAGQLMAFSGMIGGLEHGWRDAITPTFIAGVMVQAATVIAALRTDAVQGRNDWAPDKREAYRMDQAEHPNDQVVITLYCSKCGDAYFWISGDVSPICPSCEQHTSWTTMKPFRVTWNDKQFLKQLRISAEP